MIGINHTQSFFDDLGPVRKLRPAPLRFSFWLGKTADRSLGPLDVRSPLKFQPLERPWEYDFGCISVEKRSVPERGVASEQGLSNLTPTNGRGRDSKTDTVETAILHRVGSPAKITPIPMQ